MQFIDILISSVLALIMFGIGASLALSDFRQVFNRPRALILGLILQMLFLPVLAFAIASFTDLSPAIKVGLVIISICPGGTTSNFISYLVNADVALSISLTSINSILILITIPLFSSLALNYFMGIEQSIEASLGSTFFQVLFIVLIPALLGVLVNRQFPKTSAKLRQPLKYINVILLALVFAIKFFADQNAGGSGLTGREIAAILPSTFILHIAAMIISYFLARRLALTKLKSTTIGIEVGLQNTTLALLVAGTILANNEMTKPALVYAIFSFFTTLLFAYIASGEMKKNLASLKK